MDRSPELETSKAPFERPGRVERLFNACMGVLVRRGLGPSHIWELEVRGRKSGKLRRLPVDILESEGALFLVAPRGRTQWVRNAEVQGEVALRRGRREVSYRLRVLADAEKPQILKLYLDRFQREVQRFFPVPAGSPVERFAALAERYPVFELRRAS